MINCTKMSRITFDLIRKRSEHNEGEISTLEEISLHQENIEKIELLNQACRNLKILLLQYNLISKIENLNKLKKLEYLNLALNNIEVIENLNGLESLKKLDLTVNFIGDVRDVKTLRCNEHLEDLSLLGNPCAEYEGYRAYVVAALPQLKQLDSLEITRTERIKSLQIYAQTHDDVTRGYQNYRRIRQRQIEEHHERITKTGQKKEGNNDDNEEEENRKFWNSPSYHTPEDRVLIAERRLEAEKRERNGNTSGADQTKPKHVPPKLFSSDGRPYNVNQPKVSFTLNDYDDPRHVILDVAVYRHLDTSYIDVDIQPLYVRVTIKGKVLQLTLPCEICVDGSSAKRNVTTGSLTITMPCLNPSQMLKIGSANTREGKPSRRERPTTIRRPATVSKRELLEIGPPDMDNMDFSSIYEDSKKRQHKTASSPLNPQVASSSRRHGFQDFQDNPDVPPLE